MTDDADRAARAFEDVVAVENVAPGMKLIVTWSDAYTVDARDAGCNCPDKKHRDISMCKHDWSALAADTDDLPAPGIVADGLSHRPVADGGERPEDCECHEGDALRCWPCARDGFETVNPEAEA